MTNMKIETIASMPFGMVNAYLVVHGGKAMLVDTGLPGAEEKIETALGKHGLGWSDIALTILTHAHIDHAGTAVSVRNLSGTPLVAHRDEVPYCRGEAPLLKPTGSFGKLFHKTGAIEQPFEYFTPDIIIDHDALDLSEHGFPTRILFTPGHTPGSISVILDNGRVIAGDLVASGILLGGIVMRSRPKRPPFEENKATVASSLDRLLTEGCREFFIGHGGPLPSSAVKKHITTLRNRQKHEA